MTKMTFAWKAVLCTAITIFTGHPAMGQETGDSGASGGIDIVAEIRILSLPVSVDKNNVQQCGVIDQLLRSTDIRNVEVQCPSHSDSPAVLRVPRSPSPSNPNPGKLNPKDSSVNPTNNRQGSVLVVSIQDETVVELIQKAKGDVRSSLVQAPTVTMHSGQPAEISMSSHRPFVTGVQPIIGDFALAYQPIISLIPEGMRLRITASAGAEAIEMDATVEDWEIKSVEEFTMSGVDGKEISLQVPDVNVDSVHATGSVTSGGTLLLIPSRTPQPVQPTRAVPMNAGMKLFRKVDPPTISRTVIMITLRKIEPVSQPSPPQPEPELLSDEQVLSFYMGSGR